MKIVSKFKNLFYYRFFLKYFNKNIMVFNRHNSYESYVNKQLEKTLNPNKISKWMGIEWKVKVEGFKNLFNRNEEFIFDKKSAICLGSRTGQEVFVLRQRGINAIGIDLAEFPPYTIKGDIHNVPFEDKKFDLIFTNILDHSLYLEKFISEIERVSMKGAIIILNLQINIRGDEYSENMINDPKKIIDMFKKSILLKNRKIKNTFDNMNNEIILKKND